MKVERREIQEIVKRVSDIAEVHYFVQLIL